MYDYYVEYIHEQALCQISGYGHWTGWRVPVRDSVVRDSRECPSSRSHNQSLALSLWKYANLGYEYPANYGV